MCNFQDLRNFGNPAGLLCTLRACFILFIMIAWCGSPLVWAGDYDIMLDASGSMRGFKAERETWQKLLSSLESSAQRKYQFGNKDNFRRVKAALINVRLRDKATYLGEALEDWLKESQLGEVVVIITDNVADIGSDSSQSQQVFYDLLNKPDSPFSHIAIFPITLPFNGKVYSLGSGKAKLYKGTRALSIYVIAREPYSDEDFEKLRESILNKIKNNGFEHQDIQIKPFESKTVSGLLGDIEIDTTSTQQDANVSFELQPDGTKHLIVKGLSLDNEIKFSFNVGIQSSSSFELQNVELLAQIELFKEEDETLKNFELTDNFTAQVNPRRATISPDKLEDISVSFQNEAFSFRDVGFFQKLFLSLQEETLTVHGNLDIEFSANRDNMKLSQGILTIWSTDASDLGKPEVDVQKRVYKLGQLVKSMLPETEMAHKLYSIPVTLELSYPPYALYSLPFLFLFGFLVFIVYKMILQPKTYVLENEMGSQQEITLGFLQSYQHGNESLTFSLTFWGFFFWVSVPRPFRLNSHVVTGGQYIKISGSESDDEYNWQLRRTDVKDIDDWSERGVTTTNLFSKFFSKRGKNVDWL